MAHKQITQFLNKYDWLTEAYVSDFFVLDLWDRVPLLWRNCLEDLTPEDLAALLDVSLPSARLKLPLSLESFRICADNMAVHREYIDPENPDLMKRILENMNSSGNASNGYSEIPSQEPRYDQISEAKADKQKNTKEKLKHIFRKHVKPKKQHEIKNLAKTIKHLCEYSRCHGVVDVGAGHGHLSRLLTFGHGLKVTTVEASGCHAPKAQKFDRETVYDLKKVQRKAQWECSENAYDREMMLLPSTDLPSHVVCRIPPDISPDQFVNILQQTADNMDLNNHSETIANIYISKNDSGNCMKDDNNLLVEDNQRSSMQVINMVIDDSSESMCNVSHNDSAYKSELNDMQDESKRSWSGEEGSMYWLSEDSIAESRLNGSCEFEKGFNNDVKSSGHSGNLLLDVSHNDSAYKSELNDMQDDFKTTPSSDAKYSMSWFSQDSISETKLDKISEHFDTRLNGSCEFEKGFNNDVKSSGHADNLLLAGLHACGDLSQTMLRVFVRCPAVTALASVACCYRKLTTDSDNCTERDISYPMSAFVRSLPGHELDYEARELACHFIDTYKQRLLNNPPHLKVHCYRAALQEIVLQQNPTFQHGRVKLKVKDASKITMLSYVKTGLSNFGLDPTLTSEQVQILEEREKRWKDVVAFFTVRLALAPVIETLLLLDRMIYLFENGIPSVLIPIFDPSLSPRNFVLLSVKNVKDDYFEETIPVKQ